MQLKVVYNSLMLHYTYILLCWSRSPYKLNVLLKDNSTDERLKPEL